MKNFTKTITTVYNPAWIKEGFMVYDETFINIRSKMKYKANKCFKCNHYFELGEMIALACFKDKGNKVLCQKCAGELKE